MNQAQTRHLSPPPPPPPLSLFSLKTSSSLFSSGSCRAISRSRIDDGSESGGKETGRFSWFMNDNGGRVVSMRYAPSSLVVDSETSGFVGVLEGAFEVEERGDFGVIKAEGVELFTPRGRPVRKKRWRRRWRRVLVVVWRWTEMKSGLLRPQSSYCQFSEGPEEAKYSCKEEVHEYYYSLPRAKNYMKTANLPFPVKSILWVRTGCLPGWTHEYDEMISSERKLRPWLLTSKSNMTYHERNLPGLCPLNALEVTRLLKALGAPKNARIYWAGGNPMGGKEALLPLIGEFPNLYNKEDLALPGELEPFANKASFMSAIDYLVAENSDVFMPSHGGNMGHVLQGHRAYAGHKKYIKQKTHAPLLPK
ncbi:hypothetical protein RHMOL_Rhmol10G0079400 [Rhododendron molle]|uniref:Uncharacterized protein n=1 Tax=Rhododendron molle TaxID=49168 RepID=A0ACC0M177_RHOML|nr:hypothetical protein RHMOL_Rhmol10G0079400 [Rhododendron molle]